MPKARSIPERTVGQCVYCGAKDRPLTEEHILAAGLGGVATLLEASCEKCQTEINENVEQPCMQKMFRDIRYKLGIGSRRLNKRPTGLEARITESFDDEVLKTPSSDPAAWSKVLLP